MEYKSLSMKRRIEMQKGSKAKGIREILEYFYCKSFGGPKPLRQFNAEEAETEIKQSLLKEIEGKWPKSVIIYNKGHWKAMDIYNHALKETFGVVKEILK